MLDPKLAEGIDARIGFRLGAETFLGHLANGQIELARGGLDGAELILTGTPPVLAAAIYGGQPLAELESQDALRIEGDRAFAERLVTLFPLPRKAERPVLGDRADRVKAEPLASPSASRWRAS